MPSGSCFRSQYHSWLTGSQPSVIDKTAYLPSSDIWEEDYFLKSTQGGEREFEKQLT